MARQAYVFHAVLDGFEGVRRTIAVRNDQTLVDLHRALQQAFGWDDDHLYSFWLDGEFWARDAVEYTHPFALDPEPFAGGPGRKSADRRLDRLRLATGQRVAYVFDFGDEWRVRLTLRAIAADDGGDYPRVLDAVGDAPPQYVDHGDEADSG